MAAKSSAQLLAECRTAMTVLREELRQTHKALEAADKVRGALAREWGEDAPEIVRYDDARGKVRKGTTSEPCPACGKEG